MKRFLNYLSIISGFDAENGKTFVTCCPCTGEPIAEYSGQRGGYGESH